MGITLGNLVLDDAYTTVRERYEEVGGRDARRIELSGLAAGAASVDAIEAALDAIMDAASDETADTCLTLRPGRRLWVRRAKFSREVSKDRLIGSFALTLEARDAFEESTTLRTVSWAITSSGATKSISGGGNLFALPAIALAASGNVVNPSFSDGTRTLVYEGTVVNGQTLVFDGPQQLVTLAGKDVGPYTTGLFPRIEPSGTTLRYADAASSSHQASVQVAVRDRWW